MTEVKMNSRIEARLKSNEKKTCGVFLIDQTTNCFDFNRTKFDIQCKRVGQLFSADDIRGPITNNLNSTLAFVCMEREREKDLMKSNRLDINGFGSSIFERT